MRGRKRSREPQPSRPPAENASEDLYELNVDDRFRLDGAVNVDSSLGTAASPEETAPGDSDGPTR